MQFAQLGLCEPVLRAVLTEGYHTPTPIQGQTIPLILEGRDVLGCAQTGTGKTAAFSLPMLHRLVGQGNPPKGSGRKTRALILASTRELALQINESLQTYGQFTSLRSAVIYGGVSQGSQIRALQHGVDIIVATPGRLIDLMEQGYVHLQSVETLVLDEADRMLDMGFLPAVRRIVKTLPSKRQTLLFSATMPEPIVELANSILHKPQRVTIAPVKKTTELVEQSLIRVPQKQKIKLLIEMLKDLNPERVIVFSKTKYGADRIAKHLIQENIKAAALHGNKTQATRQRLLAEFKDSEPPVLVATDIAARGIDVDQVSHVFNFDLPHEAETYVHRIGRTGRAGATGHAISFCDYEEQKFLSEIERHLGRKLPVARTIEATAEDRAESSQRGGRSNGHRGGDSQRSGRQGSPRNGAGKPASSRGSSPRSGSGRPAASSGRSSGAPRREGQGKPGFSRFAKSPVKAKVSRPKPPSLFQTSASGASSSQLLQEGEAARNPDFRPGQKRRRRRRNPMKR